MTGVLVVKNVCACIHALLRWTQATSISAW